MSSGAATIAHGNRNREGSGGAEGNTTSTTPGADRSRGGRLNSSPPAPSGRTTAGGSVGGVCTSSDAPQRSRAPGGSGTKPSPISAPFSQVPLVEPASRTWTPSGRASTTACTRDTSRSDNRRSPPRPTTSSPSGNVTTRPASGPPTTLNCRGPSSSGTSERVPTQTRAPSTSGVTPRGEDASSGRPAHTGPRPSSSRNDVPAGAL